MAIDFNIACADCRKTLWIGARSLSGDYIFSFQEKGLALADFLFAHIGHELSFDRSDKYSEYEDCTKYDS